MNSDISDKKNDKTYDLIIVGSGPAGMNCALYAARANLNVLVLEKSAPGGKMTSTFRVDNWIGDESISGARLALRMLKHTKESGVQHQYGDVEKINSISEFEKSVTLKNNITLNAKAVVIATGMINRIPNDVEGIRNYENKGVSYCVICDGPFNKGKPAAIIGGGNSAIEEAIYLSSLASEVNIFVRDDKLIAEKSIIKDAQKLNNIKFHYNSKVIKLLGKDNLEEIIVSIDGIESKMKVNALFPYIGFIPVATFASHLDIFDSTGFILTDENMETKEKGVYGIGDIRVKSIRQIITAASDGAIAGKVIGNKIK
ncbi:MAG: FAD-dependent oxidoreductase [Mycoplasmataceae bacterium]|nr:FAD-dependent oxidoreductase [Mycoplasmataceae bacterium]